MSRKKPKWLALALIGLLSAIILIEEMRLPFSAAADSWLILAWVLLFYGALAVWISRNREALERQPGPRDCVGRQIMDIDAKDGEESIDPPKAATPRPAPRAFGNSKAV
jgi:hypothetical protein